MDNPSSYLFRRSVLGVIGSGFVMSAIGTLVPAFADDVTGTWITPKNQYGEVFRIDFAPDGSYRRLYQLSPRDITIETGQFEIQRDGSVRLYNIRLRGPHNTEEILDRVARDELAMRDSLRSTLHRVN